MIHDDDDDGGVTGGWRGHCAFINQFPPFPSPKSLRRLRVVAEDVAGGSCVVMVATGEEYGHRRRVEQLLAIVNDDLGWNMSNDAPGEEEKVNDSRLT